MSQEHQIKIEALYKDLMSQGLIKSKKTVKAFGDEAEKSGVKVKTMGSRVKGFAGNSLKRMTSMLKSTTLQMVGFAAAAAAIGQGTRIFLETEKALAEVATISPEVAENINEIGDAVGSLALRFGEAEAEVSKGLYQTISAGVSDPVEALEALEVALGLSKAGVAETTETTDLLVGTMNAFSESGVDATRVADIMFATVRRGKTTIGELATSMAMVTPTAAALGVSLEETNAAVATLTLSGAPTSVAVTQVGAALNALLTKSSDVNDALTQAGSSGKGFDLVRLRSEGLIPILQDLRDTYEGNEDALASLLGRKEAQLAVFGLTGDKAKIFASILDDVTNSTGDYEAALSRMAQTSATTVSAAMEGVRQGLGTLGEAFIQGVLGEDGLTGGLDEAEKSARALKETFEDLAPLAKFVGKAFEQMATIIKNAAFESAHDEFRTAGEGLHVLAIESRNAAIATKEAAEEYRAGSASMEELQAASDRSKEAVREHARMLETWITKATIAKAVGVWGVKGIESQKERLALLRDIIAEEDALTRKGHDRVRLENVATSAGVIQAEQMTVLKAVMIQVVKAYEDSAQGADDYWLAITSLDGALKDLHETAATPLPTAGLPPVDGGPSLPEGMIVNPDFDPNATKFNPAVGLFGPQPGADFQEPATFGDGDFKKFEDAGGFIKESTEDVTGATKAWKDFNEEMSDVEQQQEDLANAAIDGIGFGMTNAIMDIASGAKSAKDAFSDFASSFLSDMARMILQQQIFNAIKAIGNSFADGGVASGGVGDPTKLASGGIVQGGLIGYADGGPIVTKPHIALIGEGRHDEAVVPMPGGKEIPVNLRGGGGGIEVHINLEAMDMQSAERVLVEAADTIANVVQDKMINDSGFRAGMQGGRG